MAKLFATETAMLAIDVAIQVHGARALERGHLLEHLYRDVRGTASTRARPRCSARSSPASCSAGPVANHEDRVDPLTAADVGVEERLAGHAHPGATVRRLRPGVARLGDQRDRRGSLLGEEVVGEQAHRPGADPRCRRAPARR